MSYIFVLIVGLIAGVISGIVGTGSSIMLLPVLIYQFGPKQAVPIMAIAAIMANLSRIIVWWREVDWKAVAAYSITGVPAAAIGAQGLLRLGHYLTERGDADGQRYWQAGLTTANTLLGEPYLSRDPNHQGLLLHSIYHRPNGWDYIPDGQKVPCGESSMWGDYHLRELALYIQRVATGAPYLTFFGNL